MSIEQDAQKSQIEEEIKKLKISNQDLIKKNKVTFLQHSKSYNFLLLKIGQLREIFDHDLCSAITLIYSICYRTVKLKLLYPPSWSWRSYTATGSRL